MLKKIFLLIQIMVVSSILSMDNNPINNDNCKVNEKNLERFLPLSMLNLKVKLDSKVENCYQKLSPSNSNNLLSYTGIIILDIHKIIAGYCSDWVLYRSFKPHSKIKQLRYSPCGKHFASQGENSIKIWDANNYRLLFKLKIPSFGLELSPVRIKYSPCEKHLTVTYTNTIKVFDAKNNYTCLHTLVPNIEKIFATWFSKDGKYFITRSEKYSDSLHSIYLPKVWDIHDAYKIIQKNIEPSDIKPDYGVGFQIAYSHDKKYMVTYAKDPPPGQYVDWYVKNHFTVLTEEIEGNLFHTHNLIDQKSHNNVAHNTRDSIPYYFAFSYDKKYLATGCDDGTIDIWKNIGAHLLEIAIENNNNDNDDHCSIQ